MKFIFDWEKYASIARSTVAEGCVLLRNEEQALPIKAGETVSVFGRIQFDYYKSGTGSGGMVNAPYAVGILDALLERKDIKVNTRLKKIYEDWMKDNPFDQGEGWAQEPWSQKEMILTEEQVKTASSESDIALIILGRTAGEDKDNSADGGSYLLTTEEDLLIKNVCSQFKRVAVLLNVGNIIDMKWVDRYHPQAVMYVWQGGMEGGHGVADVLTGDVNPSGKLPDTIARDIEDYPSTKNFGDASKNIYAEDIYVGYRYFETAAKDKVLYPFGFGLSYTTFETELVTYHTYDNEISITMRVTNTGDIAGKEVIQAYVCPPQGKLGKPVRNLVGFEKTHLLEPGEEEEISIHLRSEQFASYDDSGLTGNKCCYVLEAGTYSIYVGTDVRTAKMIGAMQLNELQVLQECKEAAAPTTPFQRIRPEMKQDGSYKMIKEPAPVRTRNIVKRIIQNRPKMGAYSGDRGYLLKDVYDKKITLNTFVAQLSDEDLICMSRGEGMSSPKVTPGTAGSFGGVTEELKKFGIPIACCADGPSGIRMDCGTKAFSLPNGTAIACTFNPNLVEKLYEMEGKELRKNQIDVLLGPGVNIHRNPLNGRNFEYFSEDPFLSGKMAVAELGGMHKYGVTGTIKHFACNNQEFSRHDSDSIVSERALREIYLKPYEIAVKEGGAYCLMTSYGPVNGIWTAGQYDLLTTILHNEWGYEGMVMTDWWAKINEEGRKARRENTKVMVRAQNDVYMVTDDSEKNTGKDNTLDGLLNGFIIREQLFRNAKNICNVLLKTPAMLRIMNQDPDDWEERHRPKTDDGIMINCNGTSVSGEAVLDLTGISTEKNTSLLYELHIEEKGMYQMTFTMKSNAGMLAQMPMTVFINNIPKGTITINGTGGEYVERSVDFDVFVSVENHIRIYFGESGIEISEIRVKKQKSF